MPETPQSADSTSPGERFTRLLTQHQRHLHAFLFSVTHDRQAADDLLQEVSSILWRKFADYQEGTNFKAWAFRVARLEVMGWRRKQARIPLPLDDDTLSSLMDEAADLAESQDDRRDALEICLTQLNDKQREILHQVYHLGESVANIADERRRTPRAIYKTLGRIHEILTRCVREKMARAAIPST
ncbi:MAG: sigma-70 family RNA polymerase sigma factor [Verrucomicrobiota bacterium]